jgi:hypothetical protein
VCFCLFLFVFVVFFVLVRFRFRKQTHAKCWKKWIIAQSRHHTGPSTSHSRNEISQGRTHTRNATTLINIVKRNDLQSPVGLLPTGET